MFVEKAVLSANKIKDDSHIVPVGPPEMMPEPTDNTFKINGAITEDKDIEMIAYNNGKTDNTPDENNIKYQVNEVVNPPHQGYSHRLDQTAGPIKTLLLLIGLSQDCVFKGLTVGLQRNTRRSLEHGVCNSII